MQISTIASAGRGPELLWEQIGFPRAASRTGAALLHAPNCFLPLRRPCPGVVTVHDLAFERFPDDFRRRTGLKYRTLAPRALRSAERVIAVSQFTADDVVERYGVARDRIRVIGLAPALAPAPDAREAAPAIPGPYLLGVGDLRRKKNFATLVRAWVQLRRAGLDHRLVIAGADGGERARLLEAAEGEPLLLPGYVSDAQLDALMRDAAALVHPSLYEGFGLVVLEAMARDTPVIAARATALPLTGAGAALYFTPEDSDELAATLERLLTDDAIRDRLVAAGRARVAECSWERTARATADVYRELLA